MLRRNQHTSYSFRQPSDIWATFACCHSFGRGDHTVGNPHRTFRAQISRFQLFKLIQIRQTIPCRAVRGNSISVNSTLPASCLSTNMEPIILGSASERAKGQGAVWAKSGHLAQYYYDPHVTGQVRYEKGRRGKHECWKQSLESLTMCIYVYVCIYIYIYIYI